MNSIKNTPRILWVYNADIGSFLRLDVGESIGILSLAREAQNDGWIFKSFPMHVLALLAIYPF